MMSMECILIVHFRGPKPSPSGEAKDRWSRVVRRYRRSSRALRLQCLSRLGPEAPHPGRLRHHYEKKVRWSRTMVDFKSTPLEPLALQARVVQCALLFAPGCRQCGAPWGQVLQSTAPLVE